MWWLAYAVAQGGYFVGGGNYIKGGSSNLSARLLDRIREHGGEALAGRTAFELVLGAQGEVCGVRHRSGAGAGAEVSLATAPVVFANASPQAVAPMLPSPERDRFIAPFRDRALSISLFSMSLGLVRRPSELGVSAYSTAIIPAWMQRLVDFQQCAGLLARMPAGQLPALMVVDYSRIDSGLMDGDLFPVSVVGVDRLANWDGLSDADYRAKRAAWLDAIIERLDAEWTGFGAAVSQRDMATARTMHEFLHTPGGACTGLLPTCPSAYICRDRREHRDRPFAASGSHLPLPALAGSAVRWVRARRRRRRHWGLDELDFSTVGVEPIADFDRKSRRSSVNVHSERGTMKSRKPVFISLCAAIVTASCAIIGSAAAADATGPAGPAGAPGAASAAARPPENHFENDYVILNENHPNVDVPGYTHKAHIHHFNRVMVYMHDGGEYLHYLADGRTEDHQWKAGDVVWSPSNGWHYSSIKTDNPPYDPNIPMIVDIGIKKPGDPGKTVSTALDPLKVDPKHYKLELENSQVRVLRVKLGPKESTALHEPLSFI